MPDRLQFDEPVVEIAERFWDGVLKTEPVFATEVGDTRYDHLLPDPSAGGRAAREQLHRGILRELDALDGTRLGFEASATIAVVRFAAQRELRFLEDGLDGLWAVGHMAAGHRVGPGMLLGTLAAIQQADTPERADAYVQRLEGIPRYLGSLKRRARADLRLGFAAPRVVVARTLQQIEHLLREPVADSTATRPAAVASQVTRDRLVKTIERQVYPAYADYAEFLREYLLQANDALGLGARPNGGRIYANELLGWTTLPLEARALHERGRELVESIRLEQLQAAKSLGFDTPDEAVAAGIASGDNWFSAREQVLAAAQEQLERAQQHAPDWFGRLPRATVEVRAIDPGREEHILDHYLSATDDRPGIYFVNTRPRPRHALAAATFHEAVPGHHLQTSLEREADGRTSIRRRGVELHGTAYAEGWALYGERLADEMGLYVDDYERLGMLKLQAWRAIRLVVDTGLHVLGWSREEAVATMRSVGLEPHEAELEVDRYAALPGQALAYAVAQETVTELQESWARAGRSKQEFHDAFLSLGSLPLKEVQRHLSLAKGVTSDQPPTTPRFRVMEGG
jgi:uncharacterized protein (DUF885 family)